MEESSEALKDQGQGRGGRTISIEWEGEGMREQVEGVDHKRIESVKK